MQTFTCPMCGNEFDFLIFFTQLSNIFLLTSNVQNHVVHTQYHTQHYSRRGYVEYSTVVWRGGAEVRCTSLSVALSRNKPAATLGSAEKRLYLRAKATTHGPL